MISVVVVAHETPPDLLRGCLASVDAARATVDVAVQVVLVDNGRVPARPGASVDVHHRVGRNLGFAAAANLGTRLAAGDTLLYLNPDAVLGPGALAALERAAGPRTLLCGWLGSRGAVQVDAYLLWWSSTGRLLRRPRERRRLTGAAHLPLVPVAKVSGAALFGRRDVLTRLGPFDPAFFLYGEDVDLSVRARRAGVALYAVPAARVEHAAGSSQRTHPRLVEQARVDAALRVQAAHLPRPLCLLLRAELWAATLAGLLPGVRTSSAGRRARSARLAELRRWGLASVAAPFTPPSGRDA